MEMFTKMCTIYNYQAQIPIFSLTRLNDPALVMASGQPIPWDY